MSLYQKPGRLSTEYRITVRVLISAAILLVLGAVLAYLLEPHWVGLGLALGGVPLASTALYSYTLTRGRVKAAAETMKPPPQRVV